MVVCGLLTQLKEFHARHAAQTQAGNAQLQALPKCKVEWKPMSDAEKEATLVKKLRL